MVKKIKKFIFIPIIAVILIAAAGAIFFMLNREPLPYSIPSDLAGMGTHQKVSSTSVLFMAFPEKMDKKSVEENLITPSDIGGTANWSGSILAIQPDQKLEEGKTYTFAVGKKARFANGRPIAKDMEFQFTVAGAPKLTAHYPIADSTNIAVNTQITLVFDRPMTPLSYIQGDGNVKDWPVTITPEVKGRWRWLGTSTIVFEPENGLTLATKYTITAPKGIASLMGDKTEEDVIWSFETPRPEVTGSDPGSDSKIGFKPTLTVFFNNEMDLESAKTHIHLTKKQDSTAVETTMDYGVDVIFENDKEKKVINKTKIAITPTGEIPRETEYILTVGPDLRGLEGDLGTLYTWSGNFKTVGDLIVNNGSYIDGRVHIGFSHEVSDDKLNEKIVMSPEVKDWKDVGIYGGETVEFYPNLSPSTEYTVELKAGIKDAFGQELKEPFKFTFKTPPLDPYVGIDSKGSFSIFEKGHTPIYYINALNVSKLEVKLAKIPFEDFAKIRQAKQGSWDYRPNLSTYPQYKSLTVPVKNELDKIEIIGFDVDKELGGLESGIYAMTVQAPEYVNTWERKIEPIVQEYYFAVSGTGLTMKYSANEVLVWAVDLYSGKPEKNLKIGVYSIDGQLQYSGRTDNDGLFKRNVDLKEFQTTNNDWQPEFWVTAETDDDFAFVASNWNEGMDPWNFGLSSDFRSPMSPENRLDSFIYTERDAYRPGDTVYFKGILRLRDKAGVFSLPNQQVLVTVSDSSFNEVYNKTMKLSEFGSFSGEFPIDAGAPLGQYGINARLLPDNSADNNYSYDSFYVLEYRKPEYKVEATPEKQDYFDKETLSFDVSGAYYFGAPMPGAKVKWYANTSDYYFNKYTEDWYNFALEDVWCYWGGCNSQVSILTEGESTLDENGKTTIEFPVDLTDKALSQIVNFDVEITDANNQVVSTRASVPVHKSKVYVGIKPLDYVVNPNSNAKVGIITLDTAGQVIKNQRVTLKLYLREWNTVKSKGVDGEYYYDNEVKDTFLRDVSVTTDEKGKATAELLIDKGGTFRIVAETKDEDGRVSKAGTSIYAYSDTYINWPHTNNDRIDVIPDKPEYKIGETANLIVKSPYQGEGVKALVTVERESVLKSWFVDITSNAQPITVPITEDLVPNFYVSVVIVKPRQGESFDDNGKDTGAPAFKIGYAKIKVENAIKKIDMEITSDKAKYGPGEKVNLSVKVKDSKGNPVRSEVSIGVVDMSVEALLGFSMPDLVNTFYGERGLGVQTSQMLIYLMDIFKPGSKGGGGGDGETALRANFKDTAYWNPSVITDENGNASVSFNLPDNLTTWHILGIANTKDHLFGAAEHTVIETKDVILRPVRPRFAIVDDEMQLGAIVHNFLDEPKVFRVTLSGSGFDITGKDKIDVRVTPGGQEKVIFPINVNKADEAVFHFKAETEGGVDEIEEKIPVYVHGTPQYIATWGMVEGGQQAVESVYTPPKDEVKDGKITTTLAATMATYLPKSLDYLVTYPYGCAEQTVSSFLPNIAIKSLQGFDAFKVVDDATLEKNITAGFEKIYTFQRGDGGFGYWTDSRESNAYLTTYIVYAMNMAKKAGYAVDANSMERAMQYLDSVLRSQDSEKRMSLTTRVYILYVMSENNNADISLANNVYDQRKDLPLFAQAQLAMVYNHAGSKKANTIMDEILNKIIIDPRGAYFQEADQGYWGFSMNTDMRTNAIILQAMLRIVPDNESIPKLVRYMLDRREEGHWDTTQSTVASIFALIDYLNSTGELNGNYTAKINLNGEEVLSKVFDKTNILTKEVKEMSFDSMKADDLNPMSLTVDGAGRLYYDIVMDYFLTKTDIPAVDQGIGIKRVMEPMKGVPKDPTLLGTYKVTLTVTVPEDRSMVAIESPLPAGFEAIDFTLQTSQQNLAEEVNQPAEGDWWNSTLWYFNHIEYRDDRVFLFADYLPSGVYKYEYLMRATTPGTFHYRPARVFEMYYPENFGQTEGGLITVKE
jgi:uncharacterized protein YfaS (alpha-2-macroglobulin family)